MSDDGRVSLMLPLDDWQRVINDLREAGDDELATTLEMELENALR